MKLTKVPLQGEKMKHENGFLENKSFIILASASLVYLFSLVGRAMSICRQFLEPQVRTSYCTCFSSMLTDQQPSSLPWLWLPACASKIAMAVVNVVYTDFSDTASGDDV